MRHNNKPKVKKVEVLKHQADFINDLEHRYVGLVGGYGCGKTRAFCLKGIYLASLNVGYRGLLMEPTNSMILDVLMPDFETILNELGLEYSKRLSPYPSIKILFAKGETEILFRSAENFTRIAGLNLAFFGVDEADLIKKDVAWKMWRMLESRLRKGKVIQGFTTSTPEGFNFLYEFFVKEESEDRFYYKARTQDNPFLPENFIDSLLKNYPPNLVKAYLDGEFVNLTSGTVYYNFDRKINNTEVSLDNDKYDRHILHIGQDFNIGKCFSVVHIIVDGIPHAVSEIGSIRNTEEVIKAIQQRFPKRHIMMYPDSSGKNEKTNATFTDIKLLQDAFGKENVKYRSKNPYVSDRVGSMNAMFRNGKDEVRYYVNIEKCPIYTGTLEQQSYDKNGKPDKLHDTDHPNDAGGYFVYFRFPIQGKPTLFAH